MNKFLTALILTLMLSGIRISASAQQYLLAAGAQAEGTGGSSSWSVGMMSYSTCTGTGGDVFEGAQHPYELFFMTGQEENPDMKDVLVYPNPASEEIIVKFAYPQPLNRTIRIYNSNGVLHQQVEMVTGIMPVRLDNLAPAMYILVIYEGDRPLGTFRFIHH